MKPRTAQWADERFRVIDGHLECYDPDRDEWGPVFVVAQPVTAEAVEVWTALFHRPEEG